VTTAGSRARLGRRAQAIEDFQAFVDWSKDRPETKPLRDKREAWIKILEDGGDPFPDRASLRALRREWLD
jgi:hypothetical protein